LRLVVQSEGPIVHDLLIDRLRSAARYGRAGRHVRSWLEELIAKATGDCSIVCKDGAYYTDPKQLEFPRDWSQRPYTERKLEYIPAAELSAAILVTIGASFGIDNESAIRQAYRLMGFTRFTDNALAKGSEVVSSMIGSGTIVAREGQLKLAASAS